MGGNREGPGSGWRQRGANLAVRAVQQAGEQKGLCVSTDQLRQIADDLDESGESLDSFVMLAGTSDGDGDMIRVLSSGTDREAIVAALRKGIQMIRGGQEQ